MCKPGFCQWRKNPAANRFVCTKCNNYISFKEVAQSRDKFSAFRFRTEAIGGPIDGASLMIYFKHNQIWVDLPGSYILYKPEENYHHNQYLYEIEPLGDFVFTQRIIPAVIRKRKKRRGDRND